MADDVALAVVEGLGIFRVETGSVLDGGIDDQQDFPGQAADALEGLASLRALGFGELIEVVMATLECDCNNLENKEGWSLENRAPL